MGMFDSVFFKCPNCGNELEAQSKSGDCTLERYNKDNTPTLTALGCFGDVLQCKCGKRYEVNTNWVFLPLVLIETTQERSY